MVFWNWNACSMEPRYVFSAWGPAVEVAGTARASCVRLKGASPAAATPSPNPKNFLRDIASIFISSRSTFLPRKEDTRGILRSQHWGGGTGEGAGEKKRS